MMNIAIVGTNEVARMTGLAGLQMGFGVSFLAEGNESGHLVHDIGRVVQRCECPSISEIYLALGCPDVITTASHYADVDLIERLGELCAVYPDPELVAVGQNRLSEKLWLEHIGLPFLSYEVSLDKKMLLGAVRRFKKAAVQPCNCRTENEQVVVTQDYDGEAFDEANSHDCYLVQPCTTRSEPFSISGVRSMAGEVVLYASTQLNFRGGELLSTTAPAATVPDSVVFEAKQLLCQLLEKSGYVGAMSIDCMETDRGVVVDKLITGVDSRANWTTQGAATSQFENHIRAISGLTLGSSHTTGVTGMINLLDIELDPPQIFLSNAQVHLYGSNSGRKRGHVNINCDDQAALRIQLSQLMTKLYPTSSMLTDSLNQELEWPKAG